MAESLDKRSPRSKFASQVAAMAPAETSPTKDEAFGRIYRSRQLMSSSSPSLFPPGRRRSSRGPFYGEATTSCVSLTATGTSSSTNMDTLMMVSGQNPGAASSSASTPSEGRLSYGFIEEALERYIGPYTPQSADLEASSSRASVSEFHMWDFLPDEIQVRIFSFLGPRELVRASMVNKAFYKLCFDGQLWSTVDATDFYQNIPAASLSKLIASAGPFLKLLNLRGCIQMEYYKRTEVIAKSCGHLLSITLEGCRSFERTSLHSILACNENLVHLNLAGVWTFSNAACPIVAQSCPHLESINISWCPKLEARSLKEIIELCPKLREIRAGEVQGFDCIETAQSIFRTNKLERLVLSGCLDLNDRALAIMMHGQNPSVDLLTGRPVVPPRRLRHLDLSRCVRLTNKGVKHIGHVTPNLQGLQLSRCRLLTNEGLEPIFASSPRLTHLELDELDRVTDELFSEHLAKSPCIRRLEHLSISYCDAIGDAGMLPVLEKAVRLKSAELDNTIVSDVVLVEAAKLVAKRSVRSTVASTRARVTLKLGVYDCPHITWSGIREVMSRNAEIQRGAGLDGVQTFPTEVISLKCYFGFQMTMDEHLKRVLRGDLASARRLERKWVDYMRASQEAAAGGGSRRRRRRAREAHLLHVVEEDGAFYIAQRRARTLASCSLM